jgi:hypothetical protein
MLWQYHTHAPGRVWSLDLLSWRNAGIGMQKSDKFDKYGYTLKSCFCPVGAQVNIYLAAHLPDWPNYNHNRFNTRSAGFMYL